MDPRGVERAVAVLVGTIPKATQSLDPVKSCACDWGGNGLEPWDPTRLAGVLFPVHLLALAGALTDGREIKSIRQ